ncbi:MAG: hypothetical protein GVY12_11120 [Bacteroidetes bacterium]|nr:hypothetical protein [Bacteroidota bacterium]
MRFATATLACFVLLLTACQPEAPNNAEEAERPAPTEATIDLEIGAADGAEAFLFGQIAGITVAPDGHIVVVDWQGNTVRAFANDGAFLYTIATPGEGPGEVNRPCCPSIGPEGHLWIRDDQNRRYAQFLLADDGATPRRTITMEHTHFGLRARTTFDADGHVIDVGTAFRGGASRSVKTRFHRTSERETVREVALPQAPMERLGMIQIDQNGGTARYSIPYGTQERDAHALNGDFAYAVDDQYAVVRFDAHGDTLHVLSGTPPPVPFSDDERASIEETLQRMAGSMEYPVRDLERKVPDVKNPLRGLFFDQAHRLWVQRTVPEGAPNEADVYAPDGTLVQVVQWPADISLAQGHLTEDTLYGTRSGADTFPQVVRLRY